MKKRNRCKFENFIRQMGRVGRKLSEDSLLVIKSYAKVRLYVFP